jgi:hypothetical protein
MVLLLHKLEGTFPGFQYYTVIFIFVKTRLTNPIWWCAGFQRKYPGGGFALDTAFERTRTVFRLAVEPGTGHHQKRQHTVAR